MQLRFMQFNSEKWGSAFFKKVSPAREVPFKELYRCPVFVPRKNGVFFFDNNQAIDSSRHPYFYLATKTQKPGDRDSENSSTFVWIQIRMGYIKKTSDENRVYPVPLWPKSGTFLFQCSPRPQDAI